MSDIANRDAFLAEMLCIADTKWVLGHWYIKVMMNGRSVPDFSSTAGMAQDELGHTRALFDYLEQSLDLPENQIEFSRAATEIHNMEMLDHPPQSWGDFVVSAFIVEQALWSALEGYVGGSNKAISNMFKKFAEEGYFHRLYVDGWLSALNDSEQKDAKAALLGRLETARQWFAFDSEQMNKAGIRPWSANECLTHFEAGIETLAKALKVDLPETKAVNGAWDGNRRRPDGSQMPPRLWEYVLPTREAAKMARRPLAESVKDNIDLFNKPKKVDASDPFFEQKG